MSCECVIWASSVLTVTILKSSLTQSVTEEIEQYTALPVLRRKLYHAALSEMQMQISDTHWSSSGSDWSHLSLLSSLTLEMK